MNVVRAVSSEGYGRLRYYRELRQRLDTDADLRRYFDQESTVLPAFYSDQIRRDLGSLWEWLPAGALDHCGLGRAAVHHECAAERRGRIGR